MKYLIDGSSVRVNLRIAQWPEGVMGQLITPLTKYKRCHEVFAIDNGCFSGLREADFVKCLQRNEDKKEQCLFVTVPDKMGSYHETVAMWNQYSHLVDGWKKAFVAQDDYLGMPKDASAIFIGGTDAFKDSLDCLYIIKDARRAGKHVHIGRVNGIDRYQRFYQYADTCDGSGVSQYDYMIDRIRDSL